MEISHAESLQYNRDEFRYHNVNASRRTESAWLSQLKYERQKICVEVFHLSQ